MTKTMKRRFSGKGRARVPRGVVKDAPPEAKADENPLATCETGTCGHSRAGSPGHADWARRMVRQEADCSPLPTGALASDEPHTPAPSPLEVADSARATVTAGLLHGAKSYATTRAAPMTEEEATHLLVSALAMLEESVRRDERAKVLEAVHPGVVEMLKDERHKGHRFHWAVKCLTCIGK